MFRDERLVVSHPELAVKSKKTGQPWRENGKLVWTDPSRVEVQEYDIALAQAAAAGGRRRNPVRLCPLPCRR